jgi:hypothetical protein
MQLKLQCFLVKGILSVSFHISKAAFTLVDSNPTGLPAGAKEDQKLEGGTFSA